MEDGPAQEALGSACEEEQVCLGSSAHAVVLRGATLGPGGKDLPATVLLC